MKLFPSFFSGLLLFAAASLAAAGASGPAQPARVLTAVEPIYPYLERHAGHAAEVTVAFTVDAEGRVTNLRVKESSNPAFNATALAAIRRWTFAPAQENGRPVQARLQQTFVFSVRDLPETKGSAQFAADRRAR